METAEYNGQITGTSA